MRATISVATAVLLLALPACGDDGGPAGTPQDLTGTYSVVSFQQGNIQIPGASGTVTLTATTYVFEVEVPPITLTDAGTYTATKRRRWSSTSRKAS